MNARPLALSIMCCLLCLDIAGCMDAPGKPRLESTALRPEQVIDFPTLYRENCSACHGAQGRQGAAISLANPVYLTTAGPDNLSYTIANGLPGSLMPAFAKTRGGLLTNTQIASLTKGMIQSWGSSTALVTLSYASHTNGDAARGKIAYAAFCAGCHGAEGTGAAHVGSIVDPAYLDLISDQALRSIILAGKPEQGMPDWRTDSSQRPMTDQEVTDTVAWITTHRTASADHWRTPHE
jgi:mono/diheme cytochrome c family protein